MNLTVSQAGSSISSTGPATLLEANLRSGLTSEIHLQSLGFTMDNGRPRFKLDEPVGVAPFGPGSGTLATGHSTIDPNDTDSFVVLGKNSLESIQASSMASYAQIQQKSMTIDYNSVVASLSPAEIEQKLSGLLQENVRLKETLTQNNIAMKQQFNTLASWQEEVMKVHQNHKQKFAETRDLINSLRKENAELKTKVSGGETESENHDSKVKSLMETLKLQTEKGSTRETELLETISKLTKDLDDSRNSCIKLTMDLERRNGFDHLGQQLEHADHTIKSLKLEIERLKLNLKENEQLQSLIDYSLLSQPVENKAKPKDPIEESDKEQDKDKEIIYLRELVASLEQQLKTLSCNSFAPIVIQAGEGGDEPPSKDRLQFIQNLKQYDDQLRQLTECYSKQTSRYIGVQECLKESAIILRKWEMMEQSCRDGSNPSYSSAELDSYKKLCKHRARLIDEQLETVNERQELIKAQNQFQKVFSDYHSVLYELEILQNENAGNGSLRVQKENVEEKLQIMEEKESIKQEREKLAAEKQMLVEERHLLNREKTSLDQQNKLYEAERRSILTEKMILQENNDQLKSEMKSLQTKLGNNGESVGILRAEIGALRQEVERIPLLQTQLELFQTDFQEERQARGTLAGEKDKLAKVLNTLQQRNQSLLEEIDRLRNRGGRSDETPPSQQRQPSQSRGNLGAQGTEEERIITAYSCPKCSLSFTMLRPLEEHVEMCLNLQ